MGGFAGGGAHSSPRFNHQFGSRDSFGGHRFAVHDHFFRNHRRFFIGFDFVSFGFPYWWGVASKFGNVNPLVGSVKGATGGCTPFPAKSTHSRK
jgi:hypothetical protein